MLDDQIAWWIAGPVMGLCVVACRILFNARLGVTGGFSELIGKAAAGRRDIDWRGWFALGIVGAGALFALLNGATSFDGYGWMTRTFEGGEQLWMVPLLLVSGVLIGYGAKTAGGCTSGNGLAGTSTLSPAALASTATFFGTAIVVSLVIRALI
ncbi:YeeE/YedE family protein [Conexibacter sp. W3-3-2]|uniref:YeeE/YedE family protein n=1 Tax=Paraconexibacter algicola TaxID=2133960 RepID=A0A2T4UDF4_9ACTN|nr:MULTISPECIES: YeeE/YedE thiosulfate transporter family protein [Solirubrobacterales]MTD43603.1 YeeE/YedE family protein [Conexibacter sp. W3-3-2]PTL55536.1 hypothetical protein C7Y72_17980 [Paraconexibacter algicola]